MLLSSPCAQRPHISMETLCHLLEPCRVSKRCCLSLIHMLFVFRGILEKITVGELWKIYYTVLLRQKLYVVPVLWLDVTQQPSTGWSSL